MIIEKTELINDIRLALEKRKGFALGKLGFSEQCVAGYPLFIRSNPSQTRLKAYESVLRFHGEKQIGIFPTDPAFLKKFADEFVDHLCNLDIIGLFEGPREKEIIDGLRLRGKLIPYRLTEPDQSFPDNPTQCYLPLFQNKKILLVSPFAKLLKERANANTFEKVWSSTGKKWFGPADISTVEFPYSYFTETDTHRQFGNVLNLFKAICDKIGNEEFDVALIGAGALGIPIASYVKNMGRMGISLGGHLQVIFGVAGERWKRDPYYREKLINGSWIDMPVEYRPNNKELVSDTGAYW